MSLHEDILKIVEEELPGIGRYMLKKQLKDLGLTEESIGVEDIPKISRALSEASAMFGKEKARRLSRRIERVSGIEKAVQGEKSRDRKIGMLVDMAVARERRGEGEEAMRLYEEGLKLAEKSDFPRVVADIKRRMAEIYVRKADFESAEEALLDAREISERIFDKKGVLMTVNSLGSLEWRKGNYGRAIRYLESAQRMAERMGEKDMEGKAYMGLANIYDEMGDEEKGIHYSEMALRALEKAGDERGIVTIYNNLGVSYARMGDMKGDRKGYEKSKEYYEKCIGLSKKLDYLVMEGWASFNLAETLAKMGEFKEALKYARHSEDIFERMGDELGMSGALMSFAVIYREKGDFEEAERYFKRTIAMRRKLKTPYRIADALYEYGMLLKETDKKRAKAVLSEAAKIFEGIGNEERAKEARKAL